MSNKKEASDSPSTSLTENSDVLPSGVQITNPEELAWSRRVLWKSMGMQPHRGSHKCAAPTAQPVSLHQEEVAILVEKHRDFKVSLKADGVRYLLLLTKRGLEDGSMQHIALMFDRALVPYEVSLWAPARLFELGTLIDGELVRRVVDGANATTRPQHRVMTYLAFDIMMFAGTPVGEMPYDKRLDMLASLLEGVPHESVLANTSLAEDLVTKDGKMMIVEHDCDLRIAVKPCVTLSEVRSLWGNRHSAGFKQDGLIFMPINEKVKFGKHTGLYKWKDQHTIDVMVERRAKRDHNGDRLWNIYILDNKTLISASDASNPVIRVGNDEERSTCHLVDNLAMYSIQNSPNLIIECSIEVDQASHTLRLYPIRHRPDKTHPNSVTTIDSTIRNVMEHVHIEHLITALETGASAIKVS